MSIPPPPPPTQNKHSSKTRQPRDAKHRRRFSFACIHILVFIRDCSVVVAMIQGNSRGPSVRCRFSRLQWRQKDARMLRDP
ncbi:hypothetical protein BDR07DRAFT_1413365 [Suillus spraguei]|nr:hypothetical protein BDR07DRAFT_1413365 [Suillus spraguei]